MEALLHFTVVFAALLTVGIRPKIGVLVASFALLPDIDVLLGVHRWFLHSLIPILSVGVPAALLLRGTRLRRFASLALIAALSNPLIDAFYGYTPLFWPISKESVWVKLGANLEVGSSIGIHGFFNILTKPTTFEQFVQFEGPLATSGGIIISAVLLMPILVKVARGRVPWPF